jgi:hypothetical protein
MMPPRASDLFKGFLQNRFLKIGIRMQNDALLKIFLFVITRQGLRLAQIPQE